jgi:hypothetical protein
MATVEQSLIATPSVCGAGVGYSTRLGNQTADRPQFVMEMEMTGITKSMIAGLLGAVLISQPVFAQSSDFDKKKFFEELSTRGVKTETFDADKFFADLNARGVTASNRMDADKFFEELAARGVATPSGFDRKKFFEDIAAKGVKAPDIVNTK